MNPFIYNTFDQYSSLASYSFEYFSVFGQNFENWLIMMLGH